MAIYFSIFAWKIHGQRSLVGYSPKGCEELDMTEQQSTQQHILKNMLSRMQQLA